MTPMDPASVIQELGGGLAAVVIVGLAMAVIWLAISKERIQEARLSDMRDANKAHQDQTRETNRVLDALTDAVRDRR